MAQRGQRFRRAVAGDLRLPPNRQSGPDPFKLAEQIRQFGDRAEGMPAVQVTEASKGELMINDGVTRAFRIARSRGDATIRVEVIEHRPRWSIEHLARVRERL